MVGVFLFLTSVQPCTSPTESLKDSIPDKSLENTEGLKPYLDRGLEKISVISDRQPENKKMGGAASAALLFK